MSSDAPKTQASACSTAQPPDPKEKELNLQISRIKHKIVVLSGKGGVGKSTVATNIAVSLALSGKRVGLLDIDFHGPSIPKLLGLEGKRLDMDGGAIIPSEYGSHLKVMSIGFMLQNQDDAVIWRGPLKMGAIKQFLSDVKWGELDYLIVDSPPGTGDEPLSIMQILGSGTKAVVVTTPQDLSLSDVRKSISFCRKLNVDIVGVVENMSGFVCPKCGETLDIFKTGGGEKMANEMGARFLCRIPLDPMIVQSGDDGKPYVDAFAQSEAAKIFKKLIQPILELEENKPSTIEKAAPAVAAATVADGLYRIALPLDKGLVCEHFGHAENFALIDVDQKTRSIVNKQMAVPPTHEPGVIPNWLAEQKAGCIITGGLGSHAKDILAKHGIQVITGISGRKPEEVVMDFLSQKLDDGDNLCEH